MKLLGGYRALNRWVVQKAVLPFLVSSDRILEGRRISSSQAAFSATRKNRAWFHASSAGELEGLWPVITRWASAAERELVVTIFSESAVKPLQRLQDELSGLPCRLLFSGYCPWEGSWKENLAKFDPGVFVTTKYEAWPELWCALAEQGVPLVISGASARKSLKVGRFAAKVLGTGLPKLVLLTVDEQDRAGLEKLFPASAVIAAGEPRWDRVVERNVKGSARARELIAREAARARPWGILGQVWPSDLEIWGKQLAQVKGFLFIVPHRLDSQTLSEIEGALYRMKLTPVRSTSKVAIGDERTACLLVDEMGILSELYSAADWVYLGGGFGAGVHSTIEPAIHGVPIGCGPRGASRFPEIRQLTETGQVTVVRDEKSLSDWVSGLSRVDSAQKALWREQANRRLGAAERILKAILEASGS